MGVLRKSSFPENLETFNVLVNDTLETSRYFTLTELPDTFTGGKNSFLIQGSEELVPDTIVKIEIKDAKGNIIYTEPGEGIPEYYEGVSKPVSVYVYPDTAYGPCTITILGELDKYDDNGILRNVPGEWRDKYNVRWQKTVLVNPNLSNTSKVRFYRRPKVDITESVLPVYNRTVTRETISGSLYGVAVQPTAGSNLRPFKGDTIYELYATSSVFSASMEGETITITGLNQAYSSRIRDVVNDKRMVVFTPYFETSSNLPTSLQIVKNFDNGNFELPYNKTTTLTQSTLNTSFAKIKLTDLEAFTGDPTRLKIFAKRKADIGNFSLLEDIQLESKELLNSDIYSGSIEVNTGILSSQNIIDDFWLYSNYARDTFYTKTFDNLSLASSVKLLDDGIQNTTSTPQRIFYYSQSIDFTKDTEYQLDFSPLLSSSLYSPNKLEVYLSGSAFFNSANSNFLGKKVLTLEADSITRKYDLQQVNFKPESDGTGNLLFAIYQGNWHLANIGLRASQETNFSPNEVTLNVSLPTVVNNDEYEFKFEFYDINNNYVPVVVTKSFTFLGGSNLSNVNVSASFLSIRPDTNVFPFGYTNNYDFQEVNAFASIPVGTRQITLSVTKPGLTGDVTFTSAAFDSGGVYIEPSVYSSLLLPYPGLLTNITSAAPYLSVDNFTGSIANIEVKRIEYTASLGGYEDKISIFKVVEGTPGSDGTNGTQYVITPVSGTAIKNSDPTNYLELQLTKIDASTLTSVSSGNVKLVTGSLNTIIAVGDGILAGPNGVEYNPRIYAQKINGILTVGAYDFDQNVLVDTITLADITDGLTTGFIEASNGLILKRSPITNTYTPTTTALTASFYDSKGQIYSESILITPNYSSPNDQLKYQLGINDSNINLDYVRTNGGVLMSNNTYANTQGLTAKFTFTEPNTGQQISINEGVAIALDGSPAQQYVIRPITGTAIKNSDPTTYLEVQITKIDGTTLTDLSSGNIKLVTGSLNTVVNIGNGVTAGTNGVNYNARFYASKINGSLTVGAYDTSTSTLLDTITLADITDGLSTGYIESTNGLILGRNTNNTYTPTNTALTASFLGSTGTLYSASVLITPTYSSPNDQLTYTAGYSSPSINLESVKTSAGTNMSNGVAANTKSATVKYKFTDPNTSDIIYVSETVAVAINGTDGANPVVADYASTQTITRDKDGNNSSVVPFTIQLTETGSLLFYTSSAAKLQRGYFTLELADVTFGTDNSVNQTKSGSITPPQPASTLATSASFSYKYIDSKGNTSNYISGSHIVSVVKDGPIGPSGGGGDPTPVIIINPVTQIVTRSPVNVYSTPKPYLISVDETGSLYKYTATNPPPGNSYFTVLINSENGTLSGTANATSASVQPPTPSSTQGVSSSFAVVYRNSKGTLSQAISQSHNVGVSLDGINGPGVVFTGVWESGRTYQFDSGSSGRRDVVLWSRTGTAPYNSYYGNLRTHTADGTTSATGNGAPNYSTGSVGSAWLELGQQSFFVAAKIGLFEESYVQNTLNVGTNNNGGTSSANITLYGGNSYPYISLGQSDVAGTQGYGYDGIFLGAVNDGASGRRYKFSIVTGSSYIKWNGYGQLQISGAISASEGRIGGVTISGNTLYAGVGTYNNANTGFYLTSASSNIFSLGDKLSWDGSTLNINGNITVTGGNAATSTNINDTLLSASLYAARAAASASVSGSASVSLVQLLADGGYSGSFIGATSIYSPSIGGQNGYISGTMRIGSASSGITLDGPNKRMYIGAGNWNNVDTIFYVASGSSGQNIFSLGDKLTWNGASLFISGAVSASAGAIGGVIINTSSLFIGSGLFSSSATPFFVSSSGRFSLRDKLVFEPQTGLLFISGAISASAGAIGGVIINTSSLYIGDGIFSGSTTPFFVSSSGRFSLRDALSFEPLTGQLTISGAVSASAGAIGGVYIDRSRLYLGDGIFTGSATPFFVSSSGRFSLGDTVSYEPLTRLLKISGTLAADTIDATQISNINFGTSKGVNFASGTIGGWTLANQKLVSANTSMSFNANDASIRIGSSSAGTDKTTIVIRSGNPSALTGTNKTFSSIVDISTSAIAGTYSGNNNISNNGGAGAVNITIAPGEEGTYTGTISNGSLSLDNNLIVLAAFSGYVNVSLLIQIASDSSFTNVIYSTTIGSATYSGPTSNSTIAYSAASSTAISVNFPTATTYYCRLLWNLSSFSTQGSFTINTRTSNIYPPGANDLALAQEVSFTEITDGAFQVVRSSTRFVKIQRSGTSTTMLEVGGAITATDNITAYSSDARLKKNVIPIPNALDKIDKISGVHYEWIDDTEEIGFIPSQKTDTGVIAQDIYEVLPDAVKPAPFDTNLDGTSKSGDNYLTVQYEKIVPLLIEGIKELRKQIKELKLDK